MNIRTIFCSFLALALLLLPATSHARWMNANTGRFQTMDSYEGDQSQPLSLHKYLYGHDNPVSRIDPSGYSSLFTKGLSLFKYNKDFGDEAHRRIQSDYQAENPGAIVGSTTGILDTLKPDIFSGIKSTYGEIKPLSLSGVAIGVTQMKAYDNFYGILKGFSRETWPSDVRASYVFNTPIAYWNVNGIIFYTDEVSNEDDLAKITSVALAREFIRRGLMQRTITGVGVRIGGAVASRSVVDGARLQQHLGIAVLLGSLGGL